MKYFSNFDYVMALVKQLSEGLGMTLTIFFLTLLISLPLGMIVALGRMSRFRALRLPVSLYILVMRGTPLILQIFTIYFVLPRIFGHSFDRVTASIIAFSLNYAAYFAEIYRGGIMGVPQGQTEAAKVLGMTKAQTFTRIILPQVIKRILLPISNEVITLIKDTALVTAIGVMELYRIAHNLTNSSGSLEPLFVAGLFYLIMNSVITALFDKIIKKFDYYRG